MTTTQKLTEDQIKIVNNTLEAMRDHVARLEASLNSPAKDDMIFAFSYDLGVKYLDDGKAAVVSLDRATRVYPGKPYRTISNGAGEASKPLKRGPLMVKAIASINQSISFTENLLDKNS